MSAYYPVFLNLQGRACIVVGGGIIAERKVRYLLECGGKVTVVSPAVTAEVEALAQQGLLVWEPRRYREGDLSGAFLGVAGTDDTSVNQEVAAEANREKVLLNVVDVPELCDFIAPAVVERGPVTVAISTSGTSPALARRLREEMENQEQCTCLSWADAADLLKEVRLDLRSRKVRATPDHWQACMTDDVLHLVHSGHAEEAHRQLIQSLEQGATPLPGVEA
jgi:precorrin-2 dehydrogenase/sirohydrochlorin ferrochelatase